MGLKRITAPTLDVVPLADMRAHLRVDGTDEDAYIQALTAAAVAYLDGADGVLGWCLGAQTYLLAFDSFPDGPITLPIGPLVSVSSVTANGAAFTAYKVDATEREAVLVPDAAWPAVSGVNAAQITFTAGHATAVEIHPAVPMLVKLIVGNWFENRAATSADTMAPVPMAAEMLLHSIRRWHV